MVFDDEFSTVTFMRRGTIPPNWIDIVKLRSPSGALNNIFTSRILGSLLVLRKITEKPKVMIRASLQRIIIKLSHRHSPNGTYKKFRSAR